VGGEDGQELRVILACRIKAGEDENEAEFVRDEEVV